MSQHSVDWQAIRTDYENGMSLRQLAAKYSMSKSVIGERKYKEQWEQERTEPRTNGRTITNNQKIINRDVNAAVRAAQAITHRQAGWTYERIAQQCGYASPGAARNAVQNELNRVIVQNIEAWRNDHLSRLERLHEEAWTLAMDKSARGRLFAFDRLLAIEERQAKLLGIDARTDDIPLGTTIIREYGVEVTKI